MFPQRVLFAAALAALLFVFPAEAQRRRAVRSGLPKAAVGDCHTFGLVQAGLKATYHAEAPGGDADFTITYISDTPTRVHTTQDVSTAQGNATAETVVDGEIVGNLRAIKHINVEVVTIVPVLGRVTTEVDVDFVPSLASGPAAGWCVGAKWTVPPVTETIVTRSPAGTFTDVVTTIASEGEVLAVGESITVPAGTFRTVKYRSAIVTSSNAVQPAITWVSMEHNIVVKQDTLDAAGNVTSVTELTRM